jgi:hypothetical protein
MASSERHGAAAKGRTAKPAKKGPGQKAQRAPKAKPDPSRGAPSGARGRGAGPPATSKSLLGVIVDGVALSDESARALWIEFSAYLDVNKNDFDGFAKQKGYASVRPEHRQGRAVLVIER